MRRSVSIFPSLLIVHIRGLFLCNWHPDPSFYWVNIFHGSLFPLMDSKQVRFADLCCPAWRTLFTKLVQLLWWPPTSCACVQPIICPQNVIECQWWTDRTQGGGPGSRGTSRSLLTGPSSLWDWHVSLEEASLLYSLGNSKEIQGWGERRGGRRGWDKESKHLTSRSLLAFAHLRWYLKQWCPSSHPVLPILKKSWASLGPQSRRMTPSSSLPIFPHILNTNSFCSYSVGRSFLQLPQGRYLLPPPTYLVHSPLCKSQERYLQWKMAAASPRHAVCLSGHLVLIPYPTPWLLSSPWGLLSFIQG